MNAKTRRATLDRIIYRADELLRCEKPDASAASQFFNSPFTVTVLGGLILWLVSTSWQCQQEKIVRASQHREQLASQRQALLVEFAAQFPYSVRLAREHKAREVWLAANLEVPEARYRDRRDFIATLERYEFLLAEYLNRKLPYAYSAQIQATFDDAKSQSLASELSTTMEAFDNLEGNGTEAERRRLVRQLDRLYVDLIRSMTEALKTDD